MLVVNWCKIIFYTSRNGIYRHKLMVNYALMFFSKVILVKFIQLSVMHWIKLSLSLCKALHVRRKCNWSSTWLLEHLGRVLLCRGIPWCLPFSILRECAAKRSLVKCFLISMLFITDKYFSHPKLLLKRI
jgi:hypothetical protein